MKTNNNLGAAVVEPSLADLLEKLLPAMTDLMAEIQAGHVAALDSSDLAGIERAIEKLDETLNWRCMHVFEQRLARMEAALQRIEGKI